MRKVIVQEFVTLDGLVAGPNHNVGFIPASTQGDQSFGQEQLDLIEDCDTMLLGRVTYQMFASYWPKIKEGPEKSFADKFNALSKIVSQKHSIEPRGATGAKPESCDTIRLRKSPFLRMVPNRKFFNLTRSRVL